MQDRVPQARLYKIWNVPEYGTGRGRPSRPGRRRARRAARLRGSTSDWSTRTGSRRTSPAFVDEREIASQFCFMATAQPGGDLAARRARIDEELRAFIASGPTPDGAAAREDAAPRQLRPRRRAHRRLRRQVRHARARQGIRRRSRSLQDASLARVADATAAELRTAATRLALRWRVRARGASVTRSYEAVDSERRSLEAARGRGAARVRSSRPSQRATLSNGLKVVLARARHRPAGATSTLMLDGGYAADRSRSAGHGKPDDAACSTRARRRARARRSPTSSQRLGAQLGTGSNVDMSSVSLLDAQGEAGSRRWPLFADVVLNPAFPQSGLRSPDRSRSAGADPAGEGDARADGAARAAGACSTAPATRTAMPLTGTGTEASVEG